MRKLGIQIALLRLEDIILRYHLPEPVVSLKEPFMRKFNKDKKYFS
jgi:hypothetical protein